MQYSKILSAMFLLPLSLTLAGCLTSPSQRSETVYAQSLTKAQIEQIKINQQMKIKQEQKQKIIQNNSHSRTVYVHQPYQPYPVNSAASRNDANRVPTNSQPPAQPNQQGQYSRRQDEWNRRAREAAQVKEAKRNSLNTYAHEEARRQERAAEEARQIEQAKQNSLQTLATDEARRQERAAAEAQQIEQARQHAHAAAREDARRQERAAEEARQIELAKQESLRTYAEEEARRQQAQAAQKDVALPVIAPQPEVPTVPTVPTAVPVPAAEEWQPSEGHLVRAGDLIMELKKNNGGINPSHKEMVTHIRTNMGVSSEQAEAILGELGL